MMQRAAARLKRGFSMSTFVLIVMVTMGPTLVYSGKVATYSDKDKCETACAAAFGEWLEV